VQAEAPMDNQKNKSMVFAVREDGGMRSSYAGMEKMKALTCRYDRKFKGGTSQ
jgi:hypothetical protein